jgi:hypothetical protein
MAETGTSGTMTAERESMRAMAPDTAIQIE